MGPVNRVAGSTTEGARSRKVPGLQGMEARERVGVAAQAETTKERSMAAETASAPVPAQEIVDLAFSVVGQRVPADHGYALYGAICRRLPEVHSAGWLAVHPRHLREHGAGTTGLANPALAPTLDTGWFAKKDTFLYQRPEMPEFKDGGDAWLESTPPVLPCELAFHLVMSASM